MSVPEMTPDSHSYSEEYNTAFPCRSNTPRDEELPIIWSPETAEADAYIKLTEKQVEEVSEAVRVNSKSSQYTSKDLEKLRSHDGKLPESARGKNIVDWDGPDDPDNPFNWKLPKKIFATLIIALCTTSQYMGAAIISPAMEQTLEHFHTTRTKNALGLTMFIWGYGIGCLWFTPMSELPIFRGRNPTYLGCQLIFACLQIPTALVNHIGPFAVLRFLGGIFASPPLATAGATLSDMWEMPNLVTALVSWEFGCVAGPYLGPLIGAALVQGHNWRYIFWFMLAVSGGFFAIMVFFFPETSHQELLIRKVRRLRKSTGNMNLIAPGEIIMAEQSIGEVLKEVFFRPIKITIMEPIVLLIDIHLGLLYSIIYLFMEGIPISYMELRGWNLVQMGLAFMPFVIGCTMASVFYLFYMWHNEHKMQAFDKVFGSITVLGSCLLPVALLIWGWLERVDIHWAIGMIGNIIFAIAAFFMFQSYFAIIGVMFPPSTAGSVFASNNIVRSLMAGAFPLFGTVFFHHTATERYPVGWGCTILAFISIALIPLPIFIMVKGKALRAYAQKKYGNKRMI